MRIFFLLFAVFIFLVWMPVEAAWQSFCFNNYDLGIYSQAIKLLSFSDSNPWLSTRDVFLFNDHFDPILFLLVPLKGLLPPGLLAIRMEMLALLAAACSPLWLWKKGLLSKELSWTCAGMILFGPMTLDAAFYPAHPGTWSLAPLSWMFAFLMSGNFGWSLLMFVFTLACKEEYPFVGMAVGLILWFKGNKRSGSAFLGVSFIWAFIVFVIRPRVMGPSSMYTDAVSGLQGLSMLLAGEGSGILFQRLMELSLPILVMFYAARKFNLKWFTVPVAVLLILFAVRLAGGFWGNHRSAPLSVAATFVIAFAWRNLPITRMRMTIFILIMAVLSFPSLELGTRMWRGKAFKKHCPSDAVRLSEINESLKILRDRGLGAVLAQGNLIPPAVDLKGIAHLGATRGEKFRFLWTEKRSTRNTWPLSPEEFSSIEAKWRHDQDVKILIDGTEILLLERSL
jgi:hypothetical protein